MYKINCPRLVSSNWPNQETQQKHSTKISALFYSFNLTIYFLYISQWKVHYFNGRKIVAEIEIFRQLKSNFPPAPAHQITRIGQHFEPF